MLVIPRSRYWLRMRRKVLLWSLWMAESIFFCRDADMEAG